MKSATIKPKRGRHPRNLKSLNPLKVIGIFTIAEARRKGISQPSLSRLVRDEKILAVRRGYYIHPNTDLSPEYYDYAVACKRFGALSAIGGLTMLFHYGLVEQAPKKIWVLVPPHQKSSVEFFRCIRTKTGPRIGIHHEKYYRMTTIERTLVEALYFAPKIGLDIALKALRKAVHEGKTSVQKIYNMAEKMGMKKVIQKHWEAINL